MSDRDSICVATWKPVSGYQDLYEVSDDGRVRTVFGVELGCWPNQDGYILVRLSRPRALARVHRLVATAFIPNPGKKPFINHIDNDPANNVVANLEWCTQAENIKHAAKCGRMSRHQSGRRSPSAVFKDETVREIRGLYALGGHSWDSLARMFGVSKRCVGRLLTRETYSDV